MVDSALPHVVILGGGFGGLNAARALSRAAVRVTIVDRYNHHLFQPLLYQVAMAGLSPADIAHPIRSVLRPQKNAVTMLAEVVAVDLAARRVTLHDGAALAYDHLIVACGARTDFFGKEKVWGRWALGLKGIEDALEIRRRVLLAFETAEREPDPARRRTLLTFVIIGGGPTGVELAGALAELAHRVLDRDFRVIDPGSARVLLIEAGERLLSAGFVPELSDRAKRQLEQLGVEVRLNARVEDIDEHGVRIGSERIDAAVVLWAAGVRARSLTRRLGLELDRAGRIPVRPDCSVPGHPEVFALGDCATFVPEGSSGPLPGVAQVAIQQGRHVAGLIAAGLGPGVRPSFRYRDEGMMATIGRSRAVAQTRRLRLWGLAAWLAWLVVHVWFLIGVRNRLSVLFNWAWSYFTYRRGARLITGWRAWEWLPKESPLYAQYDGLARPPAEPRPPP